MNSAITSMLSATRFLGIIGLLIFAGTATASLGDMKITGDDLIVADVYSPYVGRAYPDQVFFGDTHLHTKLSPDAGLIGTTLSAADAFRFARGEKVISSSGQPVQLIRPLNAGTASSCLWLRSASKRSVWYGLGALFGQKDTRSGRWRATASVLRMTLSRCTSSA